MQTRRKLPIGIQTFASIIDGGYYYVDKTTFAEQLASAGKYYFLSRPRRFGKSLLLDTLKELFEGNQRLFQGLHIQDRWDWAVKHPVIRISFGGGVLRESGALQKTIRELLDENAQRLGLQLADATTGGSFRTLIRDAEAKYGQKVVVLIDEYDKPILDNITHSALAREMRDGLRDLYSVMKDMDAHLRFVFLTGVSKFSKVSIFSGLNNLFDMTLDPDYSSICGYTEEDLDRVFLPELDGLNRQQIREWYNGYNWRGEPVYNPFDLLLLFKKREFQAFWFETGTPTFLLDVLTDRGFFTPDLAKLRCNLELLSTFDIDQIASEALLFQAGYLTIRQSTERLPGQWFYQLGYPNREVESSLNASLLGRFTDNPRRSVEHRLQLIDALEINDFAALEALFTAFFASIPYQWHVKTPICQYEGYYASVFYSHFAALGLDIVLEDSSNQGRVDMTVRFNQQIYLFEFKVVEFLGNSSALAQLKAKNYAEKYRALGQPIHLIGVEFSKEQRSVVGFAVEAA